MCLSALEKSKVVETLGACRPLWVLLFPQRVILTRFGHFVIHDSLVATPTRYSLISGVVCMLGAQAARKLEARADRKLGARAAGPHYNARRVTAF